MAEVERKIELDMRKADNNLEWLFRILAFGFYDTLTEIPGADVIAKNNEHYVAAGNPGKLGSSSESDLLNNANNVSELTEDAFVVSGNSMLPDEIKEGHILHTKPINDVGDIKQGNLIVIKVDEDFYRKRHHGRNPIFKYKLRRAIMPVPKDASFEQLRSDLVGTFAEIFFKRESKDLKKSFKEAKDFYKDEELFLSLTYHNGKIHYSFHPSKNIRKVVVAVFNKSYKKVDSIDPDLLAS